MAKNVMQGFRILAVALAAALPLKAHAQSVSPTVSLAQSEEEKRYEHGLWEFAQSLIRPKALLQTREMIKKIADYKTPQERDRLFTDLIQTLIHYPLSPEVEKVFEKAYTDQKNTTCTAQFIVRRAAAANFEITKIAPLECDLVPERAYILSIGASKETPAVGENELALYFNFDRHENRWASAGRIYWLDNDDVRQRAAALYADTKNAHKNYDVALQCIARGDQDARQLKYDEALKDFTAATNAYAVPAAYLGLGNVYFRLHDFEKAIRNYDLAVYHSAEFGMQGVVPEAKTNALMAYGMEAYYLGGAFNDRAIAVANENMLASADVAYNLTARADAYLYKGQYQEAFADYDAVIKRNPNSAEAYASRAAGYLARAVTNKNNSKDIAHAIDDLRKADSLDPSLGYGISKDKSVLFSLPPGSDKTRSHPVRVNPPPRTLLGPAGTRPGQG